MRAFLLLIFLFILNCSFDNKSGIWKNESLISKDDNDIFREFKKLAITYSPFKKIVKTPNNFEFKVPVLVNAIEWNDIFFSDTNNLLNLKYSKLNKQNFRSKKISRKNINGCGQGHAPKFKNPENAVCEHTKGTT